MQRYKPGDELVVGSYGDVTVVSDFGGKWLRIVTADGRERNVLRRTIEYLPSAEQIAATQEAIQAEWSPLQERQRTVGKHRADPIEIETHNLLYPIGLDDYPDRTGDKRLKHTN